VDMLVDLLVVMMAYRGYRGGGVLRRSLFFWFEGLRGQWLGFVTIVRLRWLLLLLEMGSSLLVLLLALKTIAFGMVNAKDLRGASQPWYMKITI